MFFPENLKILEFDPLCSKYELNQNTYSLYLLFILLQVHCKKMKPLAIEEKRAHRCFRQAVRKLLH